MNESPVHSSESEVVVREIDVTGAGAADPVTNYGQAAAITRNGAGGIRVTWKENPGNFLGFSFGFRDATPGNVKGWTCVSNGPPNGLVQDFTVYNSAFAAADLAATSSLSLAVKFKKTKVKG